MEDIDRPWELDWAETRKTKTFQKTEERYFTYTYYSWSTGQTNLKLRGLKKSSWTMVSWRYWWPGGGSTTRPPSQERFCHPGKTSYNFTSKATPKGHPGLITNLVLAL